MTRPAARFLVPCLLASAALAGCGADPTGPTGDMQAVRSDAELQSRFAQPHKPTVAFFYQPTCPHCRRMVPALTELSEQYSDRVEFVKINGVVSPLGRRHDIRGYPTVLVFVEGREVKRLRGEKFKGVYEGAIRDALGM